MCDSHNWHTIRLIGHRISFTRLVTLTHNSPLSLSLSWVSQCSYYTRCPIAHCLYRISIKFESQLPRQFPLLLFLLFYSFHFLFFTFSILLLQHIYVYFYSFLILTISSFCFTFPLLQFLSFHPNPHLHDYYDCISNPIQARSTYSHWVCQHFPLSNEFAISYMLLLQVFFFSSWRSISTISLKENGENEKNEEIIIN